MIKFFRKIRQKLLHENRIRRYLLYALGEIILVVVGILIALQINNWNEIRKQNNQERSYLMALKKEFENNLQEADRVIELNAKLLRNAQELATFTGPNHPSISEQKFSQLFFSTVNQEVQYRPGSGVINEIISSGKLDLFKNNDLKNVLASLDGLVLRIRYQENEELGIMRRDLITLGTENTSMRRMVHDLYGEMFGVDQGRFLESNIHLLSSMNFDNILVGFIYTSGFLGGRYQELRDRIEEIIGIIDTQLKGS